MTTNDEMRMENLKEKVREQQERDPSWVEYPADEYPVDVMLVDGGWLRIVDKDMHMLLDRHRVYEMEGFEDDVDGVADDDGRGC